MKKSVITKLYKMAPCREAIEWAKNQPNKQAAWDQCERGDWMLWLLGGLSGPPGSEKRKKLVLASCDCAATALKYSGKNRKVTEKAIRTARLWARGKASIEDVRAASDSASDSASASEAASEAASYAASDSASDSAAEATSYAATYATYAAAYAAYAAYADSADSASAASAAYASYAANAAAAYASTDYASYAAAYAAAYVVAYAADAAIYAAYAAIYAAYAASYAVDAARTKAQRELADIVRRELPEPSELEAVNG